jgi:hypothetical protein
MGSTTFRRVGRGGRALVVVGLVLTVAACSSSAQVLSSVGTAIDQRAPLPGGDTMAAEAAPTSDGSSAAQNGTGTEAVYKDDAKIVRTGSMSLQVSDLDGALTKARAAIGALGGYVSASTQTSDGDTPTATITYRVPSDRWDEALAALRGIAAKVLAEKTDAVEVTGQLVDLAARIKNLQASEQALQAIAARATRIQDVLDVQQQLSDVRGQIEQLEAQQALLQDQTSYGTIVVTMGPEVVAVSAAAKRWDPASEADLAAATLVAVLQAVATAGIWFGIVWLPILVVLVIVGLAVAFALRRAGLRLPRRPSEPPAVSTGPAA